MKIAASLELESVLEETDVPSKLYPKDITQLLTFSNVTFVRLEQPLNAYSPIYVTPFPIYKSKMFLQ